MGDPLPAVQGILEGGRAAEALDGRAPSLLHGMATVSSADRAAFVQERLALDWAGVERIAAHGQRSGGWMRERRFRLTGSNHGAAAGHAPDKSPTALLREMVWPELRPPPSTIARALMDYGVENEPVCAELLHAHAQAWAGPHGGRVGFAETGLRVSREHPWIGNSTDGELLVEWGDPARRPSGGILGRAPRPGAEHELFHVEIKCPAHAKVEYESIPHKYYDQITSAMALIDEEDGSPRSHACLFSVWTPHRIQVSRFDFDAAYWHNELFPALRAFYWDRFLPAQIMRERGLLAEGEVRPGEGLKRRSGKRTREDAFRQLSIDEALAGTAARAP
jgi:hypothetical protein